MQQDLEVNIKIFNKSISEPFCKRPRKPRFGYFGPVKSTYKKDEAVWFACKKPYILIGQKDIHCLQGGLWSFKEPICSRKSFFKNAKVTFIKLDHFLLLSLDNNSAHKILFLGHY